MFYEPEQFPFLSPLRASWRDVSAEYENLGIPAQPWSTNIAKGWEMIVLRVFDKWFVDPALVPTVKRITDAMPGFQTCQFSIMEPGAKIDWHRDSHPKTVRSHLGLICEPGAFLQVEGFSPRPFREGEFLLFNEDIPHTSWNEGTHRRVTFIFGFDLDPADPEPNIRDLYLDVAGGEHDS